MHTIRANLYWEYQFVLGYIAVPRSRIPLKTLLGPGVVCMQILTTAVLIKVVLVNFIEF